MTEPKKKIVGVDNCGSESVADFLVCENVANEYVGNKIVAGLNGNEGSYFYKLVPADYVLWRGMEEFI